MAMSNLRKTTGTMIILPSAYFGSTEYWTALIKGGEDVVLDLGICLLKKP